MDQQLFQYYIIERSHRAYRRPFAPAALAEEYAARGLSPRERMADRFARAASQEVPHIAPGERIVFLRTVTDLPDVLTAGEWEAMRGRAHIHELGYISNICPNYTSLVANGLSSVYDTADASQKKEIDALLDLVERYRAEALRQGREDVARTLERVPRYGARSFYEALQSFRILHYALWLEGEYHTLPFVGQDIRLLKKQRG